MIPECLKFSRLPGTWDLLATAQVMLTVVIFFRSSQRASCFKGWER